MFCKIFGIILELKKIGNWHTSVNSPNFALVSPILTMTKFYIKHVLSLVFVATATVLLFSCGKNGEQTSEQQKAQSDSIKPITEPVVSTNQSELLRTIIAPQGGDFRGFKFGDPLSKIKAEEKFELFEDSTDHVGFTYETENFEAIDILYYLDKNQALNSIRVDVYLNDAKAV